MLITGFQSHLLCPAFLYFSVKERSLDEEYWAIEEALSHPSFGVHHVRMRKVNSKKWILTDESMSFHKDDFLDGSGFGGGSRFNKSLIYGIENNAIYRIAMHLIFRASKQ